MTGWINATATTCAPIINRGNSSMISTEKEDHTDDLFGMKSFVEVATINSTIERKNTGAQKKEVKANRNKYFMLG